MLCFQVIAAVAIIIQNIGGKFIPPSPFHTVNLMLFTLYLSFCSDVQFVLVAVPPTGG